MFDVNSVQMSAGFDDRTGIVKSATDWGSWYQTIEDITAEVLVPLTTKGKDVKIKILPSSLSVAVNGKDIFSGKLFASHGKIFGALRMGAHSGAHTQ